MDWLREHLGAHVDPVSLGKAEKESENVQGYSWRPGVCKWAGDLTETMAVRKIAQEKGEHFLVTR